MTDDAAAEEASRRNEAAAVEQLPEKLAPNPALVFTKVTRYRVWADRTGKAVHSAVECAVRSDRTSPAKEFLTALRSGTRREDPNFRPPQDQDQIHDFAHLLSKIEYLAMRGEPEHNSDVNDLEAGIWEFRHGVRRLSYWDTPGDGTFTPKLRVKDYRTLPAGRFQPEDSWWYPDMDAVLRLGCAWEKDDWMAPPEKIVEALEIREEDTRHDRP